MGQAVKQHGALKVGQSCNNHFISVEKCNRLEASKSNLCIHEFYLIVRPMHSLSTVVPMYSLLGHPSFTPFRKRNERSKCEHEQEIVSLQELRIGVLPYT